MEYFYFSPRWKKYGILLLFGFLALLIRAPGLGKWCFTVDEYYYYNSVNYILDKGIPQFPSGGYYVRGPLIQYLIALTSLVFPEPEFAARFVPLVFGVLSIPLFFLLCTHFLPTFPAFLCTSILLLSSWNIEFSRFARMYAPYQFTFFSFIYFFYSGYFLNNRIHKIISWCIAYLSILVSEGSIFIPFIFLLPILLDIYPLNRKNIKLISSVIILIGFNYFVYGIDYRNLGVKNPYPKELQVEKQLDSNYEKGGDITIGEIAIDLTIPFQKSYSVMPVFESIPVFFGEFLSEMGGIIGTYPMEYLQEKILEVTPLNRMVFTIQKLGFDMPLLLPKSDMFGGVWKSVLFSIGYLLCLMGGIYVFILNFRNRDKFWEKIAIFLSAFLPLVHQYGLLFYILILLFVSHKSLFQIFSENQKYWIPYIVSTILFWISVGVTTRELLFPEESRYSKITKIFLQLFDYPRGFEAVYIPFFKVIPMLGIVVFFMLFTSAFLYLLKEKEEDNPKKFLILVIIISILMVSTFKTLYVETRYSYFYFPLLFILMYTETVSMKDFAVKYIEERK